MGDPNFADSRGWTALHYAVHFKRPCWPLLEMLMEVCDVTKRTHKGEIAVELAEACNQKDVADALREKMLKHKTGKHLVRLSPDQTGRPNDFFGTLENPDRRVVSSPSVKVLEGIFMTDSSHLMRPNMY